MKIVYVQTYPLYHDIVDTSQWLTVENRDKWMPALTAAAGHETELWGGGKENGTFQYKSEGLPEITIRTFKTDKQNRKSRNHISRELCKAAAESRSDLFVLKGMDGGIGIQLARKVLIPQNISFSVVIGGTIYHPIARKAQCVLYETQRQKQTLLNKRHVFRRIFSDDQLLKLPKSVDTELFRPMPDVEKEYDVIVMGRLISYYKNYDALQELSRACSVAVIGGGPELSNLKQNFSEITWLGHVSHQEVPQYLARGKIFFHTGLRDYFPRVIPEAAACGLPVVAFAKSIDSDVLPDMIGLRLSDHHFINEIKQLLDDSDRLHTTGQQAREHALQFWHKASSKTAIQNMLAKAETQ